MRKDKYDHKDAERSAVKRWRRELHAKQPFMFYDALTKLKQIGFRLSV